MTYTIPQQQGWALSAPKTPALRSLRRLGRLSYDLGIDLGTSNTAIYVPDQGVVVQEPSTLTLDAETREPIAFGTAAQQMLGRSGRHMLVKHPMQNGVVADFERTKLMLQHFIQQAQGRSVFRPRIAVGVPLGATQVERWALIDVVLQAGARQAFLIDQPIAAALGANLPIEAPFGHLIVDIGGGTTEVVVVSQSQPVISESIPVAGNVLNEAIESYLRHQRALRVGALTAEQIKIRYGSAIPDPQQDNSTFEVVGLLLQAGLTGDITVKRGELREALTQPLKQIVSVVKSVLGRTAPELVSDICDRGILLTGGGALLSGLDTLLSQETGLMVHIANDPLCSVALGAGSALRQHQSVLHLAS